ncbi:MAG: hypothetical protein DHS20C15_32220 [Planctomycetota bacterium]|nr:MAG: hypothetical protein DHS20C15_32220 [Planctomycetota bacterium]
MTRLLTQHPEGKQGVRIERAVYDDMKRALLRAIGRGRTGVPFKELPARLAEHLSDELFEGRSVTWYCVTVKLDLEARGVLERVPGARPQRVRRVQ